MTRGKVKREELHNLKLRKKWKKMSYVGFKKNVGILKIVTTEVFQWRKYVCL